MSTERRSHALALAALAAIVAITAAWWTLALWPGGAETPVWLERTRAVCFGAAPGGLPDAGGWVLLVGEPLGMLIFLLAAWGDAVRAALRSRAGRAVAVAGGALALVGAGAAAARVRGAGERFDPAAPAAATVQRVDRAAPPLALVDQHGDTTRLTGLAGRPVLVVFAYGHCQTVCPLIVHDAIRAAALARDARPALLVVTLDPWRDTPERLPHVAAAWGLPDDARLLGGSVPAVEAALDAWGVARRRDPATGEIVHPTTVHLVDRRGRLAFIAGGDAASLAALIARL
ncbi:MAG TPA: SCO family protein [Gemmatimonadaceae bacterium]|nr:SCO family protein [Gemmatimonadaceae bacterium]